MIWNPAAPAGTPNQKFVAAVNRAAEAIDAVADKPTYLVLGGLPANVSRKRFRHRKRQIIRELARHCDVDF